MRGTALRDEPSDKTNASSNEKQDTNDDDDDNLNLEVSSRDRAIGTSIAVVTLALSIVSVVSRSRSGARSMIAGGAGVLGGGNPDKCSGRVGAIAIIDSDKIRSRSSARLRKLDSGDLEALDSRESASKSVISDNFTRGSNERNIAISDISTQANVKRRTLSGGDSNAPSSFVARVNSISKFSVAGGEGEQIGSGRVNKRRNSVGTTLAISSSAGNRGFESEVGST